MGLSIILGVVSLAASVAGTIVQHKQAKKVSRADRESRDVQGASETVRNTLARRRAARQERIRRATLTSTAEASGALDSSGLAGAQSALRTNFGAAVSEQRGQEVAARGISAALQRSADARSKSASIGSFTKLVQGGLSLAGDFQKEASIKKDGTQYGASLGLG